MPLSPEQAVSDSTRALRAQLSAWIIKIDTLLKGNFDGVNAIKIAVDHNMDRWLIEQIVKTYEGVGWNVKHDSYSDYRESWSNLIFSPKKPVV